MKNIRLNTVAANGTSTRSIIGLAYRWEPPPEVQRRLR